MRTIQLQHLIHEEVNLLLDGEIRDGRLYGARVTMVELSGDGSRARLWVKAAQGSLTGGDEFIAALDGAAGLIRTRLAEALDMKRMPELRFRTDTSTSVFTESTEQK